MSCAVLTEAQAGSKGEKCSQTKQTNGSLKNGGGGENWLLVLFLANELN